MTTMLPHVEKLRAAPTWCVNTPLREEDEQMTRFLLIQNYAGEPMGTWEPADVRGHLDFQLGLDAELTATGELVDSQGVAERAARVTGAEVDRGPFASPSLAAFRIVEVDGEARAVEIAARWSAAPGPGGVPLRLPIEVRQVMSA
jgi:hypothetical protein